MSETNAISAAHVAPPKGKPADARLWKAAQDFQAVFLTQFVQTMRRPSTDGELLDQAAGHDVFNDMFSEAIAKEMSRTGTLGLDRAVYRQMGGRFLPPDRPGAAATHMKPEKP